MQRRRLDAVVNFHFLLLHFILKLEVRDALVARVSMSRSFMWKVRKDSFHDAIQMPAIMKREALVENFPNIFYLRSMSSMFLTYFF